MKRITSKDASGRKMRVAATFTGAMTLATVFTPALATAAHASSLRTAPCTTGRETWLHLRGYGHTQCWGYKGGRSLAPGTDFESEYCGGNNYGFLTWYAVAGPAPQPKTFHFHQRTTYGRPGPAGDYSEVIGVHISGWGGKDKC